MVTAGSPVLYLDGQKEYGDIKHNTKALSTTSISIQTCIIKLNYFVDEQLCSTMQKIRSSIPVSSLCFTTIYLISKKQMLFPNVVCSQLSSRCDKKSQSSIVLNT